MDKLIVINYEGDKPTVSGRELHAALEVKSNYTTWMERMCEYGFEENKDFTLCFPILESKTRGGHNKVDYLISTQMAKELCMIQRSEKGQAFMTIFHRVRGSLELTR